MGLESLSGAPLGARVVVRHLIEGGERATDVLGELVARTPDTVTVATRRGPVTVQLADVVAGKVVPPAPGGGSRSGQFLRRAGVAVVGARCLREADGTPCTSAVALVEELLGADTPVAVLVDDGAGVGDGGGVSDVLGGLAGGGAWSAAAGGTGGDASGPTPLLLTVPSAPTNADAGYAVAHAALERHLDRVLGRAQVHLLDPRPEAVDAARAFGWRARVFTAS